MCTSHTRTHPHTHDMRTGAYLICALQSLSAFCTFKLDNTCELLLLHCSMHVVDSGPAAEWSSENWCSDVTPRLLLHVLDIRDCEALLRCFMASAGCSVPLTSPSRRCLKSRQRLPHRLHDLDNLCCIAPPSTAERWKRRYRKLREDTQSLCATTFSGIHEVARIITAAR